jgi:hypothetical protein
VPDRGGALPAWFRPRPSRGTGGLGRSALEFCWVWAGGPTSWIRKGVARRVAGLAPAGRAARVRPGIRFEIDRTARESSGLDLRRMVVHDDAWNAWRIRSAGLGFTWRSWYSRPVMMGQCRDFEGSSVAKLSRPFGRDRRSFRAVEEPVLVDAGLARSRDRSRRRPPARLRRREVSSRPRSPPDQLVEAAACQRRWHGPGAAGGPAGAGARSALRGGRLGRGATREDRWGRRGDDVGRRRQLRSSARPDLARPDEG